MQDISRKLSLMVNFYKFCGIFPENFNEPKSSRLKFLKFWPFGMAFVNIIITLASNGNIIRFFFYDGIYNLRTDYAGLLLIISLQLRGNIDMIYTLLRRKSERKFWNTVNQLDDFIVRFLGIRINYRRENWLHLRKLVFIFLASASTGVIMSVLNYSTSEKFNRYYGSSFVLIFMNQLYMNKYVFYISIIYNRLKHLTNNYTRIQIHDYKLRVLPHAYAIVWKLTKIVKSRFTIPLIFMTFHIYVMLIFFGFVLAENIANRNFNIGYIVSIISPQFHIWFICFNCYRICKMVSFFNLN